MLDINIVDSKTKSKTSVSKDGFIRAETRPFYSYNNQVRYFLNSTYGDNLAVNAFPSSETSEPVYDGNDTELWEFSVIASFPNDFVESTDQNHTPAGTTSLDFSDSENGDICQFRRTGGLLNLSGYNNISGWLYLTNWTSLTQNIQIYGWNTITGTQVGIARNLSDYININSLNNWQQFIITFNALQLNDQYIDAIRFRIVDGGLGSVTGYLDDIVINSIQNGGPFEYFLRSNVGEELLVSNFRLSMAATYDVTLTDSNMPNLSYDKFLNLTLSNGILYRRRSNNDILYSILLLRLIDLISIPEVNISNLGFDGTTVFMTVDYNFYEPALLKYNNRDSISFRISDNFSTFNYFKIAANCKEKL